jgi:sarcosine oxidase subunit gamma
VNVTDPAVLPRRSFVYRRLVECGASFDASGLAVRTDQDAAHAGVVLCDLSLSPRIGFKGRHALAWLGDHGVLVPDEDNRATRLGGVGLTCRLAPTEALILGDGAMVDQLETACAREKPDGCYAMPRADSHAWFRIAGSDAARMLAKMCGVDLRPHKFDNLEIVQTIVARLSAIVVREDIGETLAYHLLADSASALYLWDCLVEAMTEFDGAVIGTEALGEDR